MQRTLTILDLESRRALGRVRREAVLGYDALKIHGTIPRCKAARSYLSGNVIRSQLRAGIRVNWHARRWLMGKRSTEIGNELMRLLDQQTEFLSKTAPTPEEVGEYERWLERTRELFAELEQLAKAA